MYTQQKEIKFTFVSGHVQHRAVLTIATTAFLFFAGCGDLEKPVQNSSQARAEQVAQAETDSPGLNSDSTTSNPVLTRENITTSFLAKDSFCRDVLQQLVLSEFLVRYPSAAKEIDQCRPEIDYEVYRESLFLYDFLDGKMFAIRYVVPRSDDGATAWTNPYREAFGPPTDTTIPDQFKEMNVFKYLGWKLPLHNLQVHFAYFPSSYADADLDLYGHFVNLDVTEEFVRRSKQQ